MSTPEARRRSARKYKEKIRQEGKFGQILLCFYERDMALYEEIRRRAGGSRSMQGWIRAALADKIEREPAPPEADSKS